MRRAVKFFVVALTVAATGVAGWLAPAPAVAAQTDVETRIVFQDVPESASFSREISWLASTGVTTGWPIPAGREYRPFASITRDAMAAFLYRSAGSPDYTPKAPKFSDVPASSAFYKEISWLADQGISTGWDAGGGRKVFRPYEPITRDAMAAFLYRFDDSPEFTAPADSPFVDVRKTDAFFREITWLASTGVSGGWTTTSGQEFRPFLPISRDAMAAFLYRFAAPVAPVDQTDPDAGTVTVSPAVEVLDESALAGVEVRGSTVTIPADESTGIRPGDVLAAGITPSTPEGLLVRVDRVARTAGAATVVSTSPATLADAVVTTDGAVEIPAVPVSSSFVPAADVTDTTTSGAARSAARASADASLFSKSFVWKKTVEGKASTTTGALKGSGSLSVESKITAAAKAKLGLDIGLTGVKQVSVVVTPSVTARHSLDVHGALDGKLSATLGQLDSVFTFAVGPVPVVVTTGITVSGGVTVGGEAEISYVTTSTVSSDHGFSYDDGRFSLIDTKPRISDPKTTVKASASLTAKASLDLDATVKLYGIAGVTFGAGPYATASINVTASGGTATWTCPGELGIETRVGVTAGIKVFGFSLAEWNKSTSKSWPLYTKDPCKGTAVTTPGGATPTPTPTPTGGITPAPSPSPSPSPSPAALSNVRQVAAGALSAYALKNDGTVWAWGSGTDGALGAGSWDTATTVPRRVTGLTDVRFIAAGPHTGYALKGDGTVWAWGNGSAGALGDGVPIPPSEITVNVIPKKVVGLSGVQRLFVPASGSSSNKDWGAYALTSDGSLWAWGGVALGDGATTGRTSTPVRVVNLTKVTEVAGGRGMSYALDEDGNVWAWGSNDFGELGQGSSGATSTIPARVAGLPTITAIAAGDRTGYAVAEDGTVWSWGYGAGGELGTSTGDPNRTFSPIPLQVKGLKGISAIVPSQTAVYARSADGAVWAWGGNAVGQLGNGTQTASASPVRVIGLPPARDVAGGFASALALAMDGTVWGWGDNDRGQLGNATEINSSIPVRASGLTGIQSIAGSEISAYAVAGDGTVWAWGDGGYGQIGSGRPIGSPLPVQVVGGAG